MSVVSLASSTTDDPTSIKKGILPPKDLLYGPLLYKQSGFYPGMTRWFLVGKTLYFFHITAASGASMTVVSQALI